VEKFLSLLAHNDPLSTKQQVQLFTSGLTDLPHVDVEMQKPLDIQVDMSMARAYEQRGMSFSLLPAISAAVNRRSIRSSPTGTVPFKDIPCSCPMAMELYHAYENGDNCVISGSQINCNVSNLTNRTITV
jgi:hypothetical protein